MKKTILIFLSVILFYPVISQDLDIFKSKEKNGYKIEGYVEGLQDTSVILGLLFWRKTIQHPLILEIPLVEAFTFSGEKITWRNVFSSPSKSTIF